MGTVSGNMYSDFDFPATNNDMRRVGGGNIRASLNGGGVEVKLHSVSGNIYLRKVLIHGARAAAMRIKRDRAPSGAWMDALEARAPRNVLVVAMANKLARIAWAVLSSGNEYRPVASTPA